MRSVCCGTQNSVLMFLYKGDTEDVLNPIAETCPASLKNFKNQLKRLVQKLSYADRPWPRVMLSEGARAAGAGLWPMLSWAFS